MDLIASLAYGVFGLILIWLGYKGKKLVPVVIELRDLVNRVLRSMQKDSDGGKKITESEWRAIAIEFTQLAVQIVKLTLGIDLTRKLEAITPSTKHK